MACYAVGLAGEVHELSLYCTTQYVATFMIFPHFVKNGDDAEIPLEFREHWKQIDQRRLQTDLPRIVEKVIYHHDSGDLTIELDDDRLRSLAAGLTGSPERTDLESL